MTTKKLKASEPLGWVSIPIERLVKADWNYKQENKSTSDKLREGLKRRGLIKNVVVRLLPTGYYEVVDGNHRLDEMRGLKLKEAMCFNLGVISVEEAIRISIELNDLHFENDAAIQAQRMGEIVKKFGLKDLEMTLPYSQLEIEDMVKAVDFDWTAIAKPEEQVTDTHKMIVFQVEPKIAKRWDKLKEKYEEDNLTLFLRAIKLLEAQK
jgi:hypothetical protein